MASKYVKELYSLADALEQDGRAVSAEIARESGRRMEKMEDLLLDMTLAKQHIDA